MSGVLGSTAFDGLSALTSIDLSGNSLSGPLPAFAGCSKLQTLQLSSNQFSGAVPLSWPAHIPALVSFQASHNQLVSPTQSLTYLLLLQTIDLSYNLLTEDPPGSAGAFMSTMTGPSVVTLKLSHNQIGGIFVSGWFQLSTALRTIDCSFNRITSLPLDLFTLRLTSFDASSNAITSWGSTASPSATFLYLNLQNNSGLTTSKLPSWMVQSASQLITKSGDPFECPSISSTLSQLMTVLVDASYTGYAGCKCITGTYPSPSPPTCLPIPDLVRFSLSDVTPQGTTHVADLLSIEAQQWRGLNSSTINAAQLTDAAFGQQRAVSGINTQWIINSSSSSSSSGGSNVSVSPVVTVFVSLNLDLFVGSSNRLTVTAGSDPQGQLLFAVSGTDLAVLAAGQAAAALVAAAPLSEAPLLPFVRSAMFTIQVLHPLATIQVQSRDAQGQHFVARSAFSSVCPPNYAPSPQFTALGARLSSALPSCLPVPFCTAANVNWKVAACEESSGTRPLSYSFGSPCLSGRFQSSPADTLANSTTLSEYLPALAVGSGIDLPVDLAPQCDYVPRASADTLIAFLVLALAVGVAAFVLLAFMDARHSFLVFKRPHVLLIWRLVGRGLYSVPIGSCLLAVVGWMQLGPRTDSLCVASVALWVMALACMQSALLAAVYTMQQQLTRQLFNADDASHVRRVTALQSAVLGANGLVLLLTGVTSPASMSALKFIIHPLDGGAQLPVAVCAAPSVWLSLLLGLGNVVWWIGSVGWACSHTLSIGHALAVVQAEMDWMQEETKARRSSTGAAGETANKSSTLSLRVRSRLDTMRMRAVQMSSVCAAMLLSSSLGGMVLLTWALPSSQPGSTALLASVSAALCVLGSLLPLAALLGWSIRVAVKKNFRGGKRVQAHAATAAVSAAGHGKQRSIVPTSPAESVSEDSHSNMSVSWFSDPSSNSSSGSSAYALDPFREHADQSTSFTDLGAILANPLTLVQLHSYTRRTFQEENLDFLSDARMLLSVIKDLSAQQPRGAADTATPMGELEREASSLPGISCAQLFHTRTQTTECRDRLKHEAATSSSPATMQGGEGLLPHTSASAGIEPWTGTTLTTVNGTSLSASAASAAAASSSASRLELPSFGDGRLIKRLHAQMHVCRAVEADGGSGSGACLAPRVGELLWAAFEIFNLYVLPGSPYEINVSNAQRQALRSALAALCSQASAVQPEPDKGAIGTPSAFRPMAASSRAPRGTNSAEVRKANQPDDVVSRFNLASPISERSIVTSLIPIADRGNSSGKSHGDASSFSFSSSPTAELPLPLPDVQNSLGAFLPPSCYLPVSVLRLPARVAWADSLRLALQLVVSEVAKLVSVNVLSSFRQSKEGDEANRLLTLFEQLDHCSPSQQLAMAQKLHALLTLTLGHTHTRGGSEQPLPPPPSSGRQTKPHLGLQQMHSLFYGASFQLAKVDQAPLM